MNDRPPEPSSPSLAAAATPPNKPKLHGRNRATGAKMGQKKPKFGQKAESLEPRWGRESLGAEQERPGAKQERPEAEQESQGAE